MDLSLPSSGLSNKDPFDLRKGEELFELNTILGRRRGEYFNVGD